MNIWTGIGNLTRDPDVSYTTSNDPMCVCRLSIAINDGYGDKQTTSFINVVAFGKIGENCEKYLSKGSKVAVTGRIQTGSYEKDGRKIYTTDIIASNIEFLSAKREENSAPAEAPSGFGEMQQEDIPF